MLIWKMFICLNTTPNHQDLANLVFFFLKVFFNMARIVAKIFITSDIFHPSYKKMNGISPQYDVPHYNQMDTILLSSPVAFSHIVISFHRFAT